MKKQRRWLYPNGISRDYQRFLLGLVSDMNAKISERVFSHLGAWSKDSPMRSDGFVDDLSSIILLVSEYMNSKNDGIRKKLFNTFFAVSAFNDRQYKLTVKQMLGVDVFNAEPWLVPLSRQWVAENIRLIKSIPTQHISDIEGIVLRGVQEGRSATYIKEQIQQRFSVPKNRAKLIASDQVSKANSLMTMQRLDQIGVKKYKWRTMGDSRVRDEHRARAGKVFEVGRPPTGGAPGYAIRCRCWAEAIFPNVKN